MAFTNFCLLPPSAVTNFQFIKCDCPKIFLLSEYVFISASMKLLFVSNTFPSSTLHFITHKNTYSTDTIGPKRSSVTNSFNYD